MDIQHNSTQNGANEVSVYISSGVGGAERMGSELAVGEEWFLAIWTEALGR